MDTTTKTVTVRGMTCEHCTNAVTNELTALPGVINVSIALVSGGDSPVIITSEHELDDAAIAAAVDEAGFEVVAR